MKPDPKPETKPEVKPEQPKVPEGLDVNIVSDDFEYFPESLENPAVKKQLSTEAQNILKGINNKYHTNLKYDNLLGGVYVLDKNMYLPEGTIGAQFVVLGGANDFKILFLDNNEATVELTKKWVTFMNGLNLDKEIQETVEAKAINTYEKGNYKIRIGQSTAEHTMYVEVEPK